MDDAEIERRFKWIGELNTAFGMQHLSHVNWLMNFGQIIAAQSAIMVSRGLMSASLAERQVRTIRELLAQDPNTGEVLKSLDQLLDLLAPGGVQRRPQTAEIIPADVLEKLRQMRATERAEPSPTEDV